MSEGGRARIVDPTLFGSQPDLMIWQSRAASLAMKSEEVQALQLQGLQNRFRVLKGRIPVLSRLAAEQGVEQIQSVQDGAKLLFKHSVYKSYPISLIEKNRFDRLTTWLANLTTVDLSRVDASNVSTIDDWLDLMNREAGIRMVHSTGTTGKLSFLPRAEAEQKMMLRCFRLSVEGENEPIGMDQMHVVVAAPRNMYNGYGAMIDAMYRHLFNGDESRIVTLDPGRLSADVLSLGGRLSAASSKGSVALGQISPTLLARRDELVRAHKEGPIRRAAFFDRIANELRGKRIAMTANWAMLFEMAEEGLAKGVNHVFARDSLILTAGGTKGKVLPPNYKQQVKEFLGVDIIQEAFGMSEMTCLMPKCGADRYHAMPWMILYVLDGETGELKPRSGTHTGRFGIIDLTAQTYWGGFLSGDEVTMSFDSCPCGQSGVTIHEGIRRFSEKEGGDDKITCAGAPDAHDNALAFLAEME